MATVVDENITKICRCCLCKNREMRPLFGSCLDNMLQFVADIEVQTGDGLPDFMCVPCVLQVSRAFTFKQQCQRSDQSLRALHEVVKLKEPVENNIMGTYENRETHQASSEIGRENDTADNKSKDPQLASNGNNSLDSEMAIDSLPSEIEIELSSLPRETQFSTVSAEDIQQHLAAEVLIDELHSDEMKSNKEKDLPSKFGDYFDSIKLNVVSLASEEEIDETFDEIPGDENDNEHKKMPSDEFMRDLLSEDKSKASNEHIKFNCTKCKLSFKTKESLDTHWHSSHPSDSVDNSIASEVNGLHLSFECPECHKVFAENKILKRHLKIHSPIKPHSCTECDMSFAESSNLSKHMKKHTGELRNVVGKPNLCSVCGKGFKWSSSLSKHMKHHTRHKVLNCPYCPKYYVEARSLNIHLRSHTGEKPFTCEVCKKGFTQMGNLEKHLRVHTGEKPFICPICNRGFSQSGYVAIHLRTHTGEKPYRCDVENCGRAFAGSNTLAIHKRTHTGERPYLCSICDKSFARQETANIHKRTHTGEKPHVCKICHRGFTSSGHLTGHMRSHSGTKTHECKVCLKRFAGSSSLKVHMKSHLEKTTQQHHHQIYDNKNTIFECDMCKMNIPSTVLSVPDELQSYNHEFIDDVLICSNVASIIDNGKIIEEIHDANGTNIILTTTNDLENEQQLLINLSN